MSAPTPRIPGFQLVRRIGRGGMGDVWLAKQVETGRPVALKLMRQETSEERRHQSEREAVASLNIHHENVVATVDIGRVDGRPWIAMEYAPGGSLSTRVKKVGPLSEAEAIRAGLDAARGLREAARAGIVHRDVKPANLLLDKENRIKVCDLGLVSETGDAASRLQFGTPRYSAPEQLTSDGTIDLRTDIYALGLTLYFAATGRTAADGRDPEEVMRQQLRMPLPDPRTFRPELSEGFVNLLRRMTEKEPRDRYQLWDELIIDLEHLERGQSPLSAVIATARRANVRRRWLAPALLAVVTLVGGGAVALKVILDNGSAAEVVDPTEAEARGRLVFIEEELERGVGTARVAEEFRGLARRYPGTEAATLALQRAKEIESRTEEGFKRVFTATGLAVRAKTDAGEFEAALAAVNTARPILRPSDVSRLEREIDLRADQARQSAETAFGLELVSRYFKAARMIIEETEDTDLGGLKAWRKAALERLKKAEALHGKEMDERARAAYAKAIPTILRTAKTGETAQARALLDKAAAAGGKALGDLPDTDRRILDQVDQLMARVVESGKTLVGKPVAIVSNKEVLVGRISYVAPSGIRLKGSENARPLQSLDSGTIRALAKGAPPETLAAFALVRGDAREILARLEGSDSVLAKRMRELAGRAAGPAAATVKPGARVGESLAAAADRLARDGDHLAAFRLDPKVADRFPGRNAAACEELSNQGLDLYVMSQLIEAIEMFRRAIGKDPFDGNARVNLARARLDLAAWNRSPVLLSSIEELLDAGDAFQPGLTETGKLRRRLAALRPR